MTPKSSSSTGSSCWLDYALVRYTPCIKRGETINIGLIVFHESNIDIRLLESSEKIKFFAPQLSNHDIGNLKKSMLLLTNKTSSADDQYKILANFNNNIFLSSKAQFLADQQLEYEEMVSSLFARLVS